MVTTFMDLFRYQTMKGSIEGLQSKFVRIIDNLYEHVDCSAFHYLSVWRKITRYPLDRRLVRLID
jgi:hypothetical protein